MSQAAVHSGFEFRAGEPDAAATNADEVQLLFHPEGDQVGKHFVADKSDPRGFREVGDRTGGSKRQKWYVPGKTHIPDIDALFRFVQAAAERPDVLALGAKPSRAICRDGVIRYPSQKMDGMLRATKYGGPSQGSRGHFEPASRRTIFFDLDETPIDSELARIDPEDAARQIVEHCLGEPFASAKSVVRFSSSCGLEGNKVRAQVWVLCDRAVSSERVERAVHAINERGRTAFGIGKMADDAAARPIQKRYVGGAVYDGIEDPLPRRVVLVDTKRERVKADDLPALDPTKSAKQKGRKASTAPKRAKTATPKAVRTVPDYVPDAASIPDDTDLICQASGKWGGKARGIERLIHLRFGGRVPSGWRDLCIFWASTCAANAEGNVSGRRALRIAEAYRSRYAPDMPKQKMAAYLGSLAQRADEDAKAASKSRTGRLSKSAVRKYTPSIGCLVHRLLIGPAEQACIPELRTAAARKAASRKASPSETESQASTPSKPEPRPQTTEVRISALSKMKRAAANDGTDKEPEPAPPEPLGKATGGLSAMRRATGQATATDPLTHADKPRTKRPPVGEPPRPRQETPKRSVMDILTSDDTISDPSIPSEEPSPLALAWRMGPETTSDNVCELLRRESTDKRSARHLAQARELYRRWREAEIDRIRSRSDTA